MRPTHPHSTGAAPARSAPLTRAVAAGAAAALLLQAGAGLAGTRLEGYYALSMAAQKNDAHWNVGSPDDQGIPGHYAELKFVTNPSDKIEAFAKLRAWNNRDEGTTATVEYYTPPWYSAEGHLKIGERKWETYLFYRQNRFYINDEPLLRLVDDNKLKNDSYGPMAQGLRTDFWDVGIPGVKGLGGTLIVSDTGSDVPYGDTAYIARLRHKTWNDRVTSGLMFLRKDWYVESADFPGPEDNRVYSADIAFSPAGLVESGLRLGPINLEQTRWTTEAAWSSTPTAAVDDGSARIRDRAIACEVRSIVIGDMTVHAWYNDFGEDFRSYLSQRFDGGNEFNRVQKHVEGIWLVPRKAVTAKVAYDHYRKRVADETGGGLRPTTEWYGEIYAEYMNGFKSRFAYKRWEGFDQSAEVFDFYTYPEWFGEVSVENFLAKIRMQARVKDTGTFRKVTIYGFDMQVNITDRLKGYLRAMNVNEKTEARHTLFAQLKYDLGWGADLYFEYGDPGQSDNLAYTDWFVNEGTGDNLRDRVKLILSAWF
ncbi:MAG TPA: hypothetical protein PLQ13_09720 [Candidatus Krumholzibacteria bacterium]|nr:hypothetical protein [Candidatus Krumholzibacteria bacterium]